MPAPFVGNQDYRGYLNYLGTQGNKVAGNLLKFGVGNDAGFNPVQYKNLTQDFLNTNQQLYQQYQGLNAPPQNIGSIYGGGGGGGGQVTAPKLDIAAVNARARAAAEGAVNPYYTKVLNEFLTQQGVMKQQKQAQYETDIQNLEQNLTNSLQGNEINRDRSIQDEATNQGQINTQADQFQTDTGEQFQDARLAAARGQAASGTLGTNAGNRRTTQANTQRNTQEQRQEQEFQQHREQQALLKGRSLEDLMRSDTLSTESTNKGKKQTKFDLDNYIQGLGYQEQQTRNSLEQERLQRIGQETQNQAKLGFTNYLSTIKNPAQYAAAVGTYGGSF